MLSHQIFPEEAAAERLERHARSAAPNANTMQSRTTFVTMCLSVGGQVQNGVLGDGLAVNFGGQLRRPAPENNSGGQLWGYPERQLDVSTKSCCSTRDLASLHEVGRKSARTAWRAEMKFRASPPVEAQGVGYLPTNCDTQHLATNYGGQLCSTETLIARAFGRLLLQS